MNNRFKGALIVIGLTLGLLNCSGEAGDTPGEGETLSADEALQGGKQFTLTSFGGGRDTQSMACGGTADGNWYYAADARAAFTRAPGGQQYSCGTRLQVQAHGKCVVVEVRDVGPASFVNQRASEPVLDASPLVARHLFNAGGLGWSDHRHVRVKAVPGHTPHGPQRCQ